MRLPWEWLYIGSKKGVEARVIPARGIPCAFILTGKLRRYFSLATLAAPFLITIGIIQAWVVLRKFKPHAVFCSGGYVSFPVAWAARLSRIPVILHEQTVSMGLSNRLISRFARKILLSYPSTVSQCERGVCAVVGNPVRPSLLNGDKEKGLSLLGFTGREPVVLVLGGAQGCHFLNNAILTEISKWLEMCQLVIATGENPDLHLWKTRESQLSTSQRRNLRIFPYISDELGDILKAADLVISRSGAGTIAELIAVGKPGILVPLPQSAGGEQKKNAQLLEKAGGAIVLDQAGTSPEMLFSTVQGLLGDHERLQTMVEGVATISSGDSAMRIIGEIMTVVSSGRHL